jgi:phospholipase C
MQFLIRHVFVLMMENRSFDHIFGYSGITGRDARTDQMTEVEGLIRDGAVVVHTNVNPRTGKRIPTRGAAPFSLQGQAGDVGHEFLDVLEQLCGEPGLSTLQDLEFHDDGTFKYDQECCLVECTRSPR